MNIIMKIRPCYGRNFTWPVTPAGSAYPAAHRCIIAATSSLTKESNEFHTDLQEMTKNMRNNCGQQLYRYITRVITVERLRSVEQKSVRWVHAPLPVLVSSLSTLSSHRLWPNWNDKFPVQVCIILYSPLAAIKIVIDRIEQPLANTLAGRN